VGQSKLIMALPAKASFVAHPRAPTDPHNLIIFTCKEQQQQQVAKFIGLLQPCYQHNHGMMVGLRSIKPLAGMIRCCSCKVTALMEHRTRTADCHTCIQPVCPAKTNPACSIFFHGRLTHCGLHGGKQARARTGTTGSITGASAGHYCPNRS